VSEVLELFKFKGSKGFTTRALKAPFVGEIVEATAGCQCDACRSGEAKLAELGGRSTAPKLHIQIQPIDGTYDKIQHEWLTPSQTVWSRIGLWNLALERLGVDIEYLTELTGYVFRFEEVGVVQKVAELLNEEPPENLPDGLKQATCWCPVELVKTPQREKQQF